MTIFLLFLVYVCIAIVSNRTAKLPNETVEIGNGLDRGEKVSAPISVATWNLGYAGLGAESDFLVDGGQSLFPPSRAVVGKNIEQISGVASTLDADVLFFQEVAYSGPLSLWKSLAPELKASLKKSVFWFRPDVATKLLPWPFRFRHGTVIATDLKVLSGQLIPIAHEPKPMFGLINRRYGMQVLNLSENESGERWVLINIHLSAFDDGGNLRKDQITDVFQYASTRFNDGAHVIIGGDWNMELIETRFPHQTSDEDRFWIHRFPDELLPVGWKVAVDPNLPTVRTVNQAYVPGENYLTIIDGFIVSPNVDVVDVETTNTAFQMSDHMPVRGTFQAAENQK
ncbi:hypothetical protein [Roseovarius sp. EL26]|uniref:hypothetical protein n=1 Tax=Roseovarius sp. EL26 TaxID=2126672 RepID=UPI000EA1A9DB|nr:hypothetical protein [Roseovarius sp. EL26]